MANNPYIPQYYNQPPVNTPMNGVEPTQGYSSDLVNSVLARAQVPVNGYMAQAQQRDAQVSQMADSGNFSQTTRGLLRRSAYANPQATNSHERALSRAADARLAMAARLGDEQAVEDMAEDQRKIDMGVDPNQVRQERIDQDKLRDELSDEARIANFQAYRAAPNQAIRDAELVDAADNYTAEEVQAVYADRPAIRDMLLQEVQQRETLWKRQGMFGTDGDASILSLRNFVASQIAGAGENVGAVANTYNMATKSGQERIDALNNGVDKAISSYADDIQNGAAKASDMRAEADAQAEELEGRRVYERAKRNQLTNQEATNNAELAKFQKAVDNIGSNPYQVTKEIAQSATDFAMSLTGAGLIAKGAKSGIQAGIKKAEKEFTETLAENVKDAEVKNLLAKGATPEVAEKMAQSAVDKAQQQYVKTVAEQLNKRADSLTKAGVAVFESADSVAQNAPQGYQTASSNVLALPMSVLKQTQGFKDMKEANPEMSDEDIKTKLADEAGVQGYKNAGVLSAITGAIGSRVESSMVTGKGKILKGTALNAAEEGVEEGGSVAAGNAATNQKLKADVVDTAKDVAKPALMGALASAGSTGMLSTPYVAAKAVAGTTKAMDKVRQVASAKKEEKAIEQAGKELDEAFQVNPETSGKPEEQKQTSAQQSDEPTTEFNYGNEALARASKATGQNYKGFGDMVAHLNTMYKEAVAERDNDDSEAVRKFNNTRAQVNDAVYSVVNTARNDASTLRKDIMAFQDLSNDITLSEEDLDKATGTFLNHIKTKYPELKSAFVGSSQDEQALSVFNAMIQRSAELDAYADNVEENLDSSLGFLKADVTKTQKADTPDVNLDNLSAENSEQKSTSTNSVLSKVKRFKVKNQDKQTGKLTLDIDGSEHSVTRDELEQAIQSRIADINTGKTYSMGGYRKGLKQLVEQTKELSSLVKDSGFKPSKTLSGVLNLMNDVASHFGNTFESINESEAKVLVEQLFGAYDTKRKNFNLGLMAYAQKMLANGGKLPRNYARLLNNFMSSQEGKLIGVHQNLKRMRDLQKNNRAEFTRIISEEGGFKYTNALSNQLGKTIEHDANNFKSIASAINHKERVNRVYQQFDGLAQLLRTGEFKGFVENEEPSVTVTNADTRADNKAIHDTGTNDTKSVTTTEVQQEQQEIVEPVVSSDLEITEVLEDAPIDLIDISDEDNEDLFGFNEEELANTELTVSKPKESVKPEIKRQTKFVENAIELLKQHGVSLDVINEAEQLLPKLSQKQLDAALQDFTLYTANLHSNLAVKIIQAVQSNSNLNLANAVEASRNNLAKMQGNAPVKTFGVRMMDYMLNTDNSLQASVNRLFASVGFELLQSYIANASADLTYRKGNYLNPTKEFNFLKSQLIDDVRNTFGNNSVVIYTSNESLSDVAQRSNDTLKQYVHNALQSEPMQKYIEKENAKLDESAKYPYEYQVDDQTFTIPMWLANKLNLRGVSLVENPMANVTMKSHNSVLMQHFKELVQAKSLDDIKQLMKTLGISATEANLNYMSGIADVMQSVQKHLVSKVPTLVKTKGLGKDNGINGLLNFMGINEVSNTSNLLIPNELVVALTAGIMHIIQQSKSVSSGSLRTTEEFLTDNNIEIKAFDTTRGERNAKEIPLDIGSLGSNKNALVSSTGKFIAEFLGVPVAEMHKNVMQGLMGSLGLEAANILYSAGLFKATRVAKFDTTGTELEHYDFLDGKWDSRDNTSDTTASFNALAKNGNSELNNQLFGLNPAALTNQEVYVAGNASKLKVTDKHIATELTTGNNKEVAEALQVFNNQEWKLNIPYLKLQDNLGQLFDYATDYTDVDSTPMSEYSKASKQSKNNQLLRNKEKLQELIAQGMSLQDDSDLSDADKLANIRFRTQYEITNNSRLIQTSQVNTQNQKYHRESAVLVQKDKDGKDYNEPMFTMVKGLDSANLGTFVKDTKDNGIKMYALSIAQALGVKIEKNSFNRIATQLQSALEQPVVANMLTLVKDGMAGKVEASKVNKEVAKRFQEEFGTGSYRALHALMTLSQLDTTKPKQPFYSDLFIEADGIGNGMHNITLQFSTGFTDSLFKTLTKTGVILTSTIVDAYEKSRLAGENKSLAEIIDALEGSAQIFSADLNSNVPKDVYEDVSDAMAKDMQQALNQVNTGLLVTQEVLGLDEVPTTVNNLVVSGFLEKLEEAQKRLFDKANAEDVSKLDAAELRTQAKQLRDARNAITTITVMTISGSMKGADLETVLAGGSVKKDGVSLLNIDLSTVSQQANDKFINPLVVEISRALAKAGVTPATYGGKLDGITSQLISNFQADVTKLVDKAIASQKQTAYKQAVVAMYVSNGISQQEAQQALRKFDVKYIDDLLTTFQQAKTNVVASIKTSAAALLNKAVDAIYGEALNTASKFIALSTPMFSLFEQEFMQKTKNAIEQRNLKNGWAKRENGQVIITDVRGYDSLTRKEFRSIFKSLQNLPVVATAYSNNAQLLDDLINVGNSNVKTKNTDEVFTSVQSAYQNNMTLGHIQASIQRHNKQFMEAGASTFTNTVVSTESRSQAETQKALADLGFSSLNVYDGNDGVAWLAATIGDLINRNSWDTHQRYSVMSALVHAYNNSELNQLGSIEIDKQQLESLAQKLNKNNKIKTTFSPYSKGDARPFSLKWAQTLVRNGNPLAKDVVKVNSNLLAQLQVLRAVKGILDSDDSRLSEASAFAQEFGATLTKLQMLQGYPEILEIRLDSAENLYLASRLNALDTLNVSNVLQVGMRKLREMTANRNATMAVLDKLPIKYNQYAGANRGVLLNADDEQEALRIIKLMASYGSELSDSDLVNRLVSDDSTLRDVYNTTYKRTLAQIALNTKGVSSVQGSLQSVKDAIGLIKLTNTTSNTVISNTLNVVHSVIDNLISDEMKKLPVFTNKADVLTAYINSQDTTLTTQELEQRLNSSEGMFIPNVGLFISPNDAGEFDPALMAHELLHIGLQGAIHDYTTGNLTGNNHEALNHVVETALEMFNRISADTELQNALENMIVNEQSFDVNQAYTNMSAFKASLLNMQYAFGTLDESNTTADALSKARYEALQEFIAYSFTDTDSLLRLHTRNTVRTGKKDQAKGVTKLLQHLTQWFNQARGRVLQMFGLTNKDSNAKSQLISLLSDVYSLRTYTTNKTQQTSVLSRVKRVPTIGDVKANLVDNMSIDEVIDTVVDSTVNSNEHKQYLKALLTSVNRNVDQVLQMSQVDNMTVYNFPEERAAMLSDKEDQNAMEFASELRSVGIPMNQAEENAFRLMYKVALANFAGNTPTLKAEAGKIIQDALTTIKPEKFIGGTAGYETVFSGSKSDTELAKLTALLLTNEAFKNYVNTLPKAKGKVETNTLRAMAQKALNKISKPKTIEQLGLSLAKFNFRDRLTAAAELDYLNQQHRANKRDHAITQEISRVTKGNKLTETVGAIVSNMFTGKDRISPKDGSVGHQEESFIGQMVTASARYTANNKGRPTAWSQFASLVLGERNDTHDIADAHSRNLVNTDTVRNRVVGVTLQGLKELAPSLTEAQNTAFGKLLRMSGFNFVNHSMFTVDSLRYINDSQFVNHEVTNLEARIRATVDANVEGDKNTKDRVFNYLMWQVNGLADLQRDNKAKSASVGISNFVLPNTAAIVSLNALREVVNVKHTDNLSVDLLNDVNALVSLKSMAGADDKTKQAIVDFATANPKELRVLLNNARSIYADKSNGFGLLGKDGHVSFKRNPNYDIKVVFKDDKQKLNELQDLGYQVKGYTPNGDYVLQTNVSLSSRFKTGMFGITEHSQGGVEGNTFKVLGGFGSELSNQANAKVYSAYKAELAKALRNPYYYDTLGVESSYNALINPDGLMVGFDADVPYQLAEQLVPMSDMGIESLAHKTGRIIEEHLITAQNKAYVDMLVTKYQNDPRKQNYIRLDGAHIVRGTTNLDKHSQAKINGFYSMLPQATRDYIEEQGGLYIPVSELDNIIGYHEMWISDVFTGKSFLPEAVQTTLRNVFNLFGKLTGTNPAKLARYTEQLLREGTALSKDYILNRSLIVPAANMVSNVMHLVQWGINPVQIPRLMQEGYVLAKTYQKNLNELDKVRFQLKQSGLKTNERLALETRQANLQNILNSSEVHGLVKAGILTSVTALELDDDNSAKDYSRFNELRDRTGLNTLMGKTPKLIQNVLIHNGSDSHALLTEMLDYGDFVAKYALYRHLTGKQGKSNAHALNIIREEFIDYSRNRGALFDWINKNGLSWFLNYKLGIQKIIYRSFRRNFLRTAAMMTSDTMIPKSLDPMDLYQTVPNQMASVGNVLPFGSYQTTPHWVDGFESHYLVRLLGLLH